MSVQKIIEYNLLASNGQILSDKYTFKLNILEDSGNYLIEIGNNFLKIVQPR